MAKSDSDSTHLNSLAKIPKGSASVSTAETNAAGIGSFRTYRSRGIADYSRLWSRPARVKSEAFGAKIWRRRAPLSAASPLSSAASRRSAIQSRARNCDMSISTLNAALMALAALSLFTCLTTSVRLSRARVGAAKVVKS